MDSRQLHGKERHWGKGVPRKLRAESYWKQAFTWDRKAARRGKRTLVFCASTADWADPEAPAGMRDRLWETIRQTPHLNWLLLTKRPEQIRKYLPADWGRGYLNVWLGVSAEDTKKGVPRITVLKKIPAMVRFVSFEPLLENLGELDLTGIHWVIIGGETGPKARSMDAQWAKSIVAQCRKQKVAAWVKQLGRYPKLNGTRLRLVDDDGKWDRKGDNARIWPRGLKGLSMRRHPKLLGVAGSNGRSW
jgi:protein gp37